MKKIFILTTMLALAACGGGSGGGGGAGGGTHTVPVGPALSALAQQLHTTADNSAITGMKSEILVSQTNSSDHAARVATGDLVLNGVIYDRYTLDDVLFKVAIDGNAHFNFKLDDAGGIAQASAIVGVDPLSGAPITQQLTRVVDTNGDYTTRFTGAILEFVYNEHTYIRVADNGQITWTDLQNMVAGLSDADAQTNGQWDRMEQVFEFGTFGKSDGLSLSYSDFGFMKTANAVKDKGISSAEELAHSRAGTYDDTGHEGYTADTFTHTEYSDTQITNALNNGDNFMFAGGYEIGEHVTPETNMVFKGTAHGKVYTSVQSNNTAQYATAYGLAQHNEEDPEDANNTITITEGDNSMALVTHNATLTFTPGENGGQSTETLYMPFGENNATDSDSNFYDVTVTRTGGATGTTTFEFTDNTFVAADAENETPAHSGIALAYQWDPTDPAATITSTGADNIVANMGYYGIDTPAEAAGTVGLYHEQDLNGDDWREFQFEAAYGMQPQQ